MNVRSVFLAGILCGSLSACSSIRLDEIGAEEESGRFLLYGDEKGMQAFGDALTGLVVTGKATPNTDDPHHELRRHQDSTRRARFVGVRPVRRAEPKEVTK